MTSNEHRGLSPVRATYIIISHLDFYRMLESEFKCTGIQIDLTDRCNAACLLCSRTQPGRVIETDITLEDIKKLATPEIKEMVFCGNYGDASANRHLFDIVDHLVSVNCSIQLMTNGSAHSTSYWERLAKSMGEDNATVFDLDGATKESHERYRLQTNFDKILENAQAYINAGGWAVWQMIKFPWNLDEIDDARNMAKEMGFKNFRLVTSGRNESTIGMQIGAKIGKRFYSKIEPKCVDNNLLFVTARGNIAMCCWTAAEQEQTMDLVNIRDYDSLTEALNSDKWKKYYAMMNGFKLPTCRKKCGNQIRCQKSVENFADKEFHEPY